MLNKSSITFSLVVRNLLYWLVLVATLPIAVTLLVLLGLLLPRRQRHKIGMVWVNLIMWMLQHVIGLKYRVIGEHHIPSQPSVICSKHQSGWETLALQQIFPAQVFIAKRELIWIPLFGWGLYLMNVIMIDRTNRLQATRKLMAQGLERKQHGFWISVFPEGTRMAPGKVGRYQLGAARMAIQFNMPLVPVAHNAGEFWRRNAFLKYPGEITVIVGNPILPGTMELKAMMEQAKTWIEAQQSKISGRGPFSESNEMQLLQAKSSIEISDHDVKNEG